MKKFKEKMEEMPGRTRKIFCSFYKKLELLEKKKRNTTEINI